MLPISSPLTQYNDNAGQPLNLGYLYFGQVNDNPETAPITVYWDIEGTQPAAQPIRTIGGYASRNGTPANVYSSANYSLIVKNSKGVQIFYGPDSTQFDAAIALNNSFSGPNGSSLIGWIQSGLHTILRTVREKLRERKSIADYSSLEGALASLGGAEGTGYDTAPVTLDLLGMEITFDGVIFVPINVSLINGKLTSAAGRLVWRNPFIANPSLRTYPEYWKWMTSRNKNIEFNCATIINIYIGGSWVDCDFTGENCVLALVNSNNLWTEFNSFSRCTFAGNSAAGAAIIKDGNLSGSSSYSTGSGAGASDGSFGYNNYTDCKIDSTAPTVGIKVLDGGAWYNSEIDFRGYARGAGPSGAFINVVGGTYPGKVSHCKFSAHLESFSAASNIISVENGGKFWYNNGTIQSASPEMTMAQGGAADLRGNAITVVGAVLQDAAGSVVPFGDTAQSVLTNHLLKRLTYWAGDIFYSNTVQGITVVKSPLIAASASLESQAPITGDIVSRPNDTRSVMSRNWALKTNFLGFGDCVLMESTTNLNDPSVARIAIKSGGVLAPAADNTQSLGAAAQRWSVVYAGTGAINTSDANLKQQIRPIDDVVLRAWGKVEYVQYKFNDAVEIKGDGARWHAGVIAQRVKEAFESEGLDAFEYGVLCYDEWEAIDPITEGEPGREAGSRYGIRYEEALVLECAYLRSIMAKA